MKQVQFDIKNRSSITIDQKQFNFDYVFGPKDENSVLNDKLAASIVESK
jgi:hypothetical protein